jgi:acyl carrier protein
MQTDVGQAVEKDGGRDLDALERELTELIVTTLRLRLAAHEIDRAAPLFEHDHDEAEMDGLGLDSVDALQLTVAIEETFGARLPGDDEGNRAVLSSVRRLAAYLEDVRR